MVEYFQKAIEPYGGEVFALNSDINAPALWKADHFEVCPLIYDPSYANFLFDYCQSNQIELVVPLYDIELPVLSRLKSKFLKNNIRILVGEEWLTEMANDKWLTQNFLHKHNFSTVPCFLSLEAFVDSYRQNEISFPVYVKPRWGMGSLSLYKAENLEELKFFFGLVKKEVERGALRFESQKDFESSVIIQAVLPGQEFGLDIINDLEGNYCNTIVKKKLGMRSGETDCAITIRHEILSLLGQKLASITKHPGNIDADVFLDGDEAYVLELNPRFGGGYPFSHRAGVNLPEAIVSWCLEINVPKNTLDYNEGVLSMKGIEMIDRHD